MLSNTFALHIKITRQLIKKRQRPVKLQIICKPFFKTCIHATVSHIPTSFRKRLRFVSCKACQQAQCGFEDPALYICCCQESSIHGRLCWSDNTHQSATEYHLMPKTHASRHPCSGLAHSQMWLSASWDAAYILSERSLLQSLCHPDRWSEVLPNCNKRCLSCCTIRMAFCIAQTKNEHLGCFRDSWITPTVAQCSITSDMHNIYNIYNKT